MYERLFTKSCVEKKFFDFPAPMDLALPRRGHTSMASQRVARAKRLFEGRRALAGVGLACVVFFAIGVLVRYSVLQTVDLNVTRELQESNAPPLKGLMLLCTFVGEPLVLGALGVSFAAVLWKDALPRAAGLVLMALGSVPLNMLLKLLWDRARPDAQLVTVAVETAGTSFPSGHAMGGTAFYGALAALAWIHLDPRRTRLPLTLVLIALPVAIDVSRVYLGAHWLSDVVAGSAMGLLVLIPLIRWYLRGIPAEVAVQAAKKGEGAIAPV